MKFCQIPDTEISYKASLQVGDCITEWDGFLPDNHPLKSRELLLFENANLKDTGFCYVLVYRKKKPIGLLYLQLISFNSDHYQKDVLGHGLISLIKDFILKQKANLAICGNLFRLETPGAYFSNPEDYRLVFKILRQFEKKNPGNQKFCGMLIKDLETQFDDKLISESRFKKYTHDQLMELEIREDWSVFDDYLNSLSKKYRQRASKIILAGSDIERRVFSSADFDLYEKKIDSLYQNVVSRQMIKIGILNGAYFKEMAIRKADSFQVVGYFEGNELVAFSSQFYHSELELEIHYIGFDFDKNERYALYFNILFDGIKSAISEGIKVLKFGRTGYDAKTSLGALPKSAQHFYKIKRGLPSLAFNYMVKMYASKEEGNLVVRNPFKAGPMVEITK